jgi:hypothetical protein
MDADNRSPGLAPGTRTRDDSLANYRHVQKVCGSDN